jgi:predicted ATPase
MLEAALDPLDRPAGFARSTLYVLLCEALLVQGRVADAIAVLAAGLKIATRNDERIFEAELYRLKGRAMLAGGGPDACAQAQSLYGEALATARRQNARSLELRAACDLARLWRGEGRHAEGRDLLPPVYGWFIEGFDTADLKQAKALLDELTEPAIAAKG